MTAQNESYDLRLNLPLQIRAATEQDLHHLEWYGQFTHFRRVFQRAYWEQITGKRLILVADLNGFPVGRLFMQFQSKDSRLADGTQRAYLYSFNVLEFLRGQGIGTNLLQYAEALLIQRGFTIATIAVAKENTQALRLYTRHGYKIFSETEGKWRYIDHQGQIQHKHEPAHILLKTLDSG